ncbi:MAG: metallophosphoesterase [Acidimicrobiia bacterium]
MRVVRVVLAAIMLGGLTGSTVATPGAAAAVAGSKFVALTPERILDTRPGLVPGDGIDGPIGPASSVLLTVAGRAGVPATGVTAAVLNVAVTEASGIGFVQVAPSDAPLGNTANLNITAPGQTIANQVTVPLGPDGKVRIYMQSGGHVIADVFGYFTESDATAEGRYTPLAAPNPRRVLDTRDPMLVPVANPGDTVNCGDFATWDAAWRYFWTYRRWGDPAGLDGDAVPDGIPCQSLPGGPKTAAAPADLFKLAGATTLRLPITTGSELPGGVVPPGEATAVVLNLAVTEATAAGYWQVVPTGGGTAFGTSANLNVERVGQTISNQVIVPIGADGTITIFTQNGGHVIADIAGVFTGPGSAVSTSGLFWPITPSRLVDTREPTNTPQLGAIPGGAAITIQGSGRFGIPQPVSALALNVTIADALAPGYVQVFPPGAGTPGASATINAEFAGQVISNATLATVSALGEFSIFTQTGGQLIADVAGYFTPTETPAADQVILAAGDIASCSSSDDEATAAVLAGQSGTVITLGDNVYEDGAATEFADCYGPSWGAHKARTRPSPGNHDYHTSGASGYFDYFGAAAGDPEKGYYSYDLGNWHVVSLNSNCSDVPCSASSAQVTWLRADLAASTKPCTLAYWHRPRFSSGNHGSSTTMQPLYQALYDNNADLILVGHDHDYERFAPLTPTGAIDTARGIREIVVGTGGRNHTGFGSPITGSEVRNGTAYGVLKVTLKANSYDWQFLAVAGQTFTDSGTQTCH